MDLHRSRTRNGTVDQISYTHMGKLACQIVVVYTPNFSAIQSVTVCNVSVPNHRLAILVRNACALFLEPAPEDHDEVLFPIDF